LKTEARRLGNVQIRPSVHDPAQIYGDAKVLLVPSTYPEAWARVGPEAQMSGIPVLASNIGGLPEAVSDGGVLLDPDATAETWLRRLSALWDDDAVYRRSVGMAAQRGRRSDLAPRVAGDRFESLIEEVVSSA
jgi:glycosyltransferase involved in cell wall biosynthesis